MTLLIISVRLTDDEYQPFKDLLEHTEIGKSEFFRALILNRIASLPSKPKVTTDYKRCLFYLAKTSNNFNQIAHRLNTDNAKGIISETLYKKLLNALIGIRETLQDITK
ncbi:plasmid mobilization protein [Symbiopectobacterium purcellii]|uniref:Relaxosome protein n=1 Tax=Symbiopectobacterium purcellii TaxID=2871826 RepID=A0ABX9AND3_9ENTR|nr:relaxosome protein [Symbiopectobacterium purcellii]QZN96692.1 relaxosome protein [Symbiopectobacterium purcellii]